MLKTYSHAQFVIIIVNLFVGPPKRILLRRHIVSMKAQTVFTFLVFACCNTGSPTDDIATR